MTYILELLTALLEYLNLLAELLQSADFFIIKTLLSPQMPAQFLIHTQTYYNYSGIILTYLHIAQLLNQHIAQTSG